MLIHPARDPRISQGQPVLGCRLAVRVAAQRQPQGCRQPPFQRVRYLGREVKRQLDVPDSHGHL